MSNRGTRVPPGAFLERSATFDSFSHPRAANEEPDKVERPILDSTPSHRAVAPPAGPNDEVDICVTRHFLRNLLDNFEGTIAGSGKMRVSY